MNIKVKPAKLPRDAYDVDFSESVARYVPSNKVYCPCHVTISYDPSKYKACYQCYKNIYTCCEERQV